jgi:hypothetical protein
VFVQNRREAWCGNSSSGGTVPLAGRVLANRPSQEIDPGDGQIFPPHREKS